MLETVAMRALACLSALLAMLVIGSLAAGSGSWRQALAKLVFALLLLALARLAWRRPAGRVERARRRILRLVAVLLSPELRQQWAESTPATDAGVALAADLRAALAAPDPLLAAAFDAEELPLVTRLRAELGSAPAGSSAASLGPAALACAKALQDAALARAQSRPSAAGPAPTGVG